MTALPLLIGVLSTTKDGTVSIVSPDHGVEIHLTWTEALTVVSALIRASGTASAVAGVGREDYVRAMLAELGEVPGDRP